jgi:DnaJ-class molecular chaperone
MSAILIVAFSLAVEAYPDNCPACRGLGAVTGSSADGMVECQSCLGTGKAGPVRATCKGCQGSGFIVPGKACRYCKGTGTIAKPEDK